MLRRLFRRRPSALPGKELFDAVYHQAVAQLAQAEIIEDVCSVGNQQKWDTLVKERSGRNGSVVGLPEQVVVALSSG